jgi:uncharacterized protein (DUF1330 family)
MPLAYLVSEVEVTDPEVFKTYLPLASASLEKYGGTYLARGEHIEVWEGTPAKRMVIVVFDSVEDARRWYASPEYAEAKAIRVVSSSLRMIMINGIVER